MTSTTPSPAPHRPALEPQRRPGKLRVAALLRAGADVIAERGYESATMAEIAARAGAPIGSLYRFFPTKDVLAEALVRRYGELIDTAFEGIDYRRESTTITTFADALLDSLVVLRGETQAIVALMDARSDCSERRGSFMQAMRAHIVRILRQRDPRLPQQKADDMATILLPNIKLMKSLQPERDAGAIAELRAMTRLYLAGQLGESG